MEQEEKQWYVIAAKHNGALKAQKLFAAQGIDSFVPMESRTVITKGKKASVKLVPIMLNLIFVDIKYSQLREIKQSYSFLWYLPNNLNGRSEPMIVPREQMDAFIKFIDGNYEDIEYIDVNSFNIKEGERVRITEGVFKGKEGTFVKIKGKRNYQIVVAIDGLLAVTIIAKSPSKIIEKIKE